MATLPLLDHPPMPHWQRLAQSSLHLVSKRQRVMIIHEGNVAAVYHSCKPGDLPPQGRGWAIYITTLSAEEKGKFFNIVRRSCSPCLCSPDD